jgi:chromosome segregation ATPase
MATPNPAEEFKHEFDSLKYKVNSLQNDVRLTNIRDRIEDIQTTVSNLDQKVANLRTRGYVFEKGLEAIAVDYAQQWTVLHPSISGQIESQSAALQSALRPVEAQLSQLAVQAGNPATAQSMLISAKAAVETLEGKVNAAERSIDGMFDQLNNQVSEFNSHLNKIDWMLVQISEACFQLLPTEAGIMAVKAVWAKTGKEQKNDPEGVLCLTDQRLFFEQKEEVATKKVLFIATEKQKVQKLLLEAPIAMVENVNISKQGLLKNEDHIQIKFAVGAQVQTANFHIWQSSEEWQALINRAKAKEFDKDRVVEIDRSAVEKIKAAPTQCPACGGAIDQVVLRGMDSITCKFCGNVIRL